MQFEGLRRTSHIPNLTPLIDIVFLLLVFFMLTSSFVREEVINIDLPEASTSSNGITQTDGLEVLISREGKYLYKNEYVTDIKLKTLLSDELLHKKDKVVRIKGDSLADVEKVVELIDLSKMAGAESVDIVTVKDARH